MASPTPTASQMETILAVADEVAAEAARVRAAWRRNAPVDHPRRRLALNQAHKNLIGIAEPLRRERIRAARDAEFNAQWGERLQRASDRIKRERYAVYRMLNPGGHKWTR